MSPKPYGDGRFSDDMILLNLVIVSRFMQRTLNNGRRNRPALSKRRRNCAKLAHMADLQPVKASLIADLVELINENIGALLRVKVVSCPDCGGRGTTGGEIMTDGVIRDDGTLATCATCNGIGAVERYEIDNAKLQTKRYGRLIEGFDVKHGQVVPKFRSKDKAFAMLVKLLGFDKAVLEIAGASTFAETLSVEQRATYVEQLKELAAAGLLDGLPDAG